MKVKRIITIAIAIACYWSLVMSTAAFANVPVQPAKPVVHLTLPLRHATKAPDRGRTHLLRCAKAHNC